MGTNKPDCIYPRQFPPKKQVVILIRPLLFVSNAHTCYLVGRGDLNALRPVPKAGALTCRATPACLTVCRQKPIRSLSAWVQHLPCRSRRHQELAPQAGCLLPLKLLRQLVLYQSTTEPSSGSNRVRYCCGSPTCAISLSSSMVMPRPGSVGNSRWPFLTGGSGFASRLVCSASPRS